MGIDLFRNYSLSWEPRKRALTRPYFKSIVQMMKKDIDAGVLLPGTKLPPQRELSYFLGVGFQTITRAYKLSQKMGLTYGVIGNGTYISNNVNNQLTVTKDVKTDITELGFISSFDSSNRFLKSTIKAVANQANILTLLDYDHQTGLTKHKLIANKYLKRIGMHVNQQNTLITSGGQNALTITLMGLFNSGDKIAVNQFTYSNFIELARLNGIMLIPIESDHHGMRADLLDKLVKLNHIKGVYFMPDDCNPTNEVIDLPRRHELAKVVNDNNLIMIEDDYLNYLNLYRRNPLPKISNLTPEQSVYICSMSKSIIPGLRVAFMCVADQYKNAIDDAFISSNFKTSALDVDIITRSLENGIADKIMNDKVSSAIKANHIFDDVFSANNNSRPCLFRTIPISNILAGKDVENLMARYQIRIFHSDRFAVINSNQKCFLRISLSSINDPIALRSALQKLKHILLANDLR